MCGRFAFHSPRDQVTQVFGVELPLEVEPRYNIAPTQQVLAIRAREDGSLEPVMLRWGLVPFWAKDLAIGNRMINARSETIADKPAFRAAFRHRRCIVLGSGFYEWRRARGGKVPYYISRADADPIAMAGLWERWDNQDEPLESCAIITTGANRKMAQLHDRMPVILSPGDVGRWVNAEEQARQELLDLLVPCPDDVLEYREVSRAVNNPRHEGSDLIAAV